jgi:hypothetical protein
MQYFNLILNLDGAEFSSFGTEFESISVKAISIIHPEEIQVSQVKKIWLLFLKRFVSNNPSYVFYCL